MQINKKYKVCVYSGREGVRSAMLFFENWKKTSWFLKNMPGLPFKMLFEEYLRGKTPEIFPVGPFFDEL